MVFLTLFIVLDILQTHGTQKADHPPRLSVCAMHVKRGQIHFGSGYSLLSLLHPSSRETSMMNVVNANAMRNCD
jgi:hypothetical protein